jgi:hypothetical protein
LGVETGQCDLALIHLRVVDDKRVAEGEGGEYQDEEDTAPCQNADAAKFTGPDYVAGVLQTEHVAAGELDKGNEEEDLGKVQ